MIRNISLFVLLAGSATAFGGLGGNFGLNFKTNSLRLRGGSTTQMNAMPKLTYFDAKGVAETARIMFKAAGAEFEDERFKVRNRSLTDPPPFLQLFGMW